MRKIVIALSLALAAACTIDARTTSGSEDGGIAATDGGTDDGSEADVGAFEIAYTAPANATAVTFCSNFPSSTPGAWYCGIAKPWRKVEWTGGLSIRRLGLPACTAHAVGQNCGYVWNASFNVSPFWAAVKGATGGLAVVGESSVSGPVPVDLVLVENGLGGANIHLRRR